MSDTIWREWTEKEDRNCVSAFEKSSVFLVSGIKIWLFQKKAVPLQHHSGEWLWVKPNKC